MLAGAGFIRQLLWPPFAENGRWLLAALTTLLSVSLTVAAAEVVLRVAQIPFRVGWIPSENALARFDPELGWSYIPGRSHTQAFGASHREVSMHFDALGARVGRPGVVHDPTRATVLFVGDSYTMGHGLPYEETFVGRLDGDPGFALQVVNLGVQAYGTDQALLLLERQIGHFRTVAVVYTFIADHVLRNGNDDRRLLIPTARFLGTKPLFGLRRDGSLYLRKRAARYEDLWQSSLWNWVRLAWQRHGPAADPRLTLALVRRMREVAASRRAPLVMVVWRQGPPQGGVPVIDWADPATSPVAAGHVVDTGLDPPAGWDTWQISGDSHPDAAAHARVARLVKEEFARLGLRAGSP